MAGVSLESRVYGWFKHRAKSLLGKGLELRVFMLHGDWVF